MDGPLDVADGCASLDRTSCSHGDCRNRHTLSHQCLFDAGYFSPLETEREDYITRIEGDVFRCLHPGKHRKEFR